MLELRKSGLLLLGILIWNAPALAQSGSRVSSGLLDEQVLNQRGLTRAWWSQAVMNPRRDKLTYITNDERNIYVQCSNGVITTFDAESGKQKWAAQVGQADSPASAASTNGDKLILWSRASLFILNKENGKILKSFKLPGQPSTSAQADDEQVYLGFLDGSMYAFDIETGDMNWRYRTSGRISVPAMLNGSTVLFASNNGSLYSVDALTRTLQFQFEATNTLSAPMARYKDLVLLASEDYKLYSLDVHNGSQGWKSPFLSGERIIKAPVVIGDDVFLTPEHRGLFRIAAKNGKDYWHRKNLKQFVSASPQNVYAVDRLNHLVVLNRDTGETISGIPLGRLAVQLVNNRTDRVYLGTKTGMVICLRELSRSLPRYHINPQEQPLLPQFAPEQTDAAAK